MVSNTGSKRYRDQYLNNYNDYNYGQPAKRFKKNVPDYCVPIVTSTRQNSYRSTTAVYQNVPRNSNYHYRRNTQTQGRNRYYSSQTYPVKREFKNKVPWANTKTEVSNGLYSRTTYPIKQEIKTEHQTYTDIKPEVQYGYVTSNFACTRDIKREIPFTNIKSESPDNFLGTPTLPIKEETSANLPFTKILQLLPKLEQVQQEEISFSNIRKQRKPDANILSQLYKGQQCSSCDARFLSTDAAEYKEHLDWHFRQNRKNRQEKKVRQTRGWYPSLKDFCELIDEQDPTDCFFAKQQRVTSDVTKPLEVTESKVPESCPGNSYCEMCLEPFLQAYDDDQEEWLYKQAVNFDNHNFHPTCLGDYKRRQNISTD